MFGSQKTGLFHIFLFLWHRTQNVNLFLWFPLDEKKAGLPRFKMKIKQPLGTLTQTRFLFKRPNISHNCSSSSRFITVDTFTYSSTTTMKYLYPHGDRNIAVCVSFIDFMLSYISLVSYNWVVFG